MPSVEFAFQVNNRRPDEGEISGGYPTWLFISEIDIPYVDLFPRWIVCDNAKTKNHRNKRRTRSTLSRQGESRDLVGGQENWWVSSKQSSRTRKQACPNGVSLPLSLPPSMFVRVCNVDTAICKVHGTLLHHELRTWLESITGNNAPRGT